MRNIFKLASLLTAAVMLFACEKVGTTGEELRIVSDKDVIQANGTDAANLQVMLGDKDVTSESVFYNENHELLNVVDGKFTVTETGEHMIYADYGTMSTYNKNAADNGLFMIKAINVPVPELPVDADPANTSFVHRAMLTQYTGTACPNCPRMTKIIRDITAEGLIPAKAVHTAVHSYTSADPMYISAPSAQYYPFLTVDNVQGFKAENGIQTLKGLIEEHSKGTAKAGISVSPAYYEAEGTLVIKVAVKAAQDGIFNVGAWLLENDIYAQQSDNSGIADKTYDIHENAVRIADSRYKGAFDGYPLGTLSAGEVAEKTFVMNLKSKWEVENMHLAVFVLDGVKAGSRTDFSVCNVVDVPIDAPTPFEYAK